MVYLAQCYCIYAPTHSYAPAIAEILGVVLQKKSLQLWGSTVPQALQNQSGQWQRNSECWGGVCTCCLMHAHSWCGGRGLPLHIIWGFINDPLNILFHGELYLTGSTKIFFIPRYSCTFPCIIVSGASLPNSDWNILITSVTMAGSLCEILRSSTCHIIVHCLPLILLFATHESYGLSSKSTPAIEMKDASKAEQLWECHVVPF